MLKCVVSGEARGYIWQLCKEWGSTPLYTACTDSLTERLFTGGEEESYFLDTESGAGRPRQSGGLRGRGRSPEASGTVRHALWTLFADSPVMHTPYFVLILIYLRFTPDRKQGLPWARSMANKSSPVA